MKKVSLLVLLLVSLFILSGCGKGKLDGVTNISVEDIFNQKEDKYFIYFHRLECEDCEKADPYVIQYARVLKEYEACSGKRKIYAVLLYTESEKQGLEAYIYREYTGGNGQGTDGKYFVNGVTKWQDLYIASTASMISISKNAQGVKVASYMAQGNENILAQLEAQLNNCNV